VRAEVDAALPDEYRGWPVRFGWDAVPVQQHVEVAALGAWLEERLGFDASRQLTTRDWLVTPQQRLLEVTAGAVFRDDGGDLRRVREALAWYPDDVWLWLLGCQWRRLSQEEAFAGRTAEVGDELGARVVAARLVRELVRLCFLLERRYAPYSKWLGSAFGQLDAAATLGDPLRAALDGDEDALVAAFEEVARRQNALGVAREVEPTVRGFHNRPYRVLDSARFADACLERVENPWLRALPPVGAVDQVADSTDVLAYPRRARRLAALYEAE
jgi:hypothetical protein